MRKAIGSLVLIVVGSLSIAQDAIAQEIKPDPWSPVRFMIGTWRATASGSPGEGSVVRTYEFVLKNQFIEERNVSTYRPSEKNPKGEVHEHRGFISYDKERKTLVLRQFHQESFVNTYVLNQAAGKSNRLVFESERFENFDNAWKGKETYEIVSKDEFVETFELAPPGKPFQVYSRSHFRREK
jgi:hypothetical protein